MNRALLFPLVVLVAACGSANADQSPKTETVVASSTATRVEVAIVQPSEARLDLALPGEIEGGQDSLLASPLGGYVERVRVHENQAVSKGEVLVEIDGEVYGAQLAQAEAQQALAESELKRLKALGDLATPAQLEQAETQVTVAKAAVRMARAQVSRAVIRAPFAGTVASIGVDVGEVAAPGAPVVRLVSLDPVKVTLSVPDRDVVALHEGMPVAVTTNAVTGVLDGVVTHIAPAADLQTRAFPVDVQVDNPGHVLKPGMIAQVSGTQSVSADAIVIPQDWVVTTLAGQGVFLENEGVAQWRPITLGALVRDQVVVATGLAPGDRVVMTGHRDLVDGDELLVEREGTCCTLGRPVFDN